MGWLSRGGLASGDGGERMPWLLMLADWSMPERPSSRPVPGRLVPPEGIAAGALRARLPLIPRPAHSRLGSGMSLPGGYAAAVRAFGAGWLVR